MILQCLIFLIIGCLSVPLTTAFTIDKQPKLQIYTHHTRLCDTSIYRGIVRLSQVKNNIMVKIPPNISKYVNH